MSSFSKELAYHQSAKYSLINVTGLRQQRDVLYVSCEDECGVNLKRKVKRTRTYALYIQGCYMHIKPQL